MADYSKIIVYDDVAKKHIPVTGYIPFDTVLQDNPDSTIERLKDGFYYTPPRYLVVSYPYEELVGFDSFNMENDTKIDMEIKLAIIDNYDAEHNVVLDTFSFVESEITRVYWETYYAYGDHIPHFNAPHAQWQDVVDALKHGPNETEDHILFTNAVDIVDSGFAIYQIVFPWSYAYTDYVPEEPVDVRHQQPTGDWVGGAMEFEIFDWGVDIMTITSIMEFGDDSYVLENDTNVAWARSY